MTLLYPPTPMPALAASASCLAARADLRRRQGNNPREGVFRRLLSTSLRMPLPRDDKEAVVSLLTVLSLNTNKRADLGGLHTILKETKPHLVFLQEVISYNAASALASTFGYILAASTLHRAQIDLILVTLTRLPATVLEIRPGMAQLVTVGAFPFIHLHAP
jgi:hypothetical protein